MMLLLGAFNGSLAEPNLKMERKGMNKIYIVTLVKLYIISVIIGYPLSFHHQEVS